MEISFEPWGGWLIFHHPFRRLPPNQPESDSPTPMEDFIDPGSESLRRDSALYREFAEVKPTEEGVRAFLEKHTDLGTEPPAIYGARRPDTFFVFPADYKQDDVTGRAILEAILMRRCVSLWDMVRRNDQKLLARHFRRSNDPSRGLLFTYDSHPRLPRDQRPSPPDFRERSSIIGSNTYLEQLARSKPNDLRPAARAYLAGVINYKLKSGLSGHVIDVPGIQKRMELHLVPQTLLAALWFQFAEEVTGNFTSSRCLFCQGWFRPI